MHHRLTLFLFPQEVTETHWYKTDFETSNNLEIETKHTLEVNVFVTDDQFTLIRDTVSHAHEDVMAMCLNL